VRLPLTNLGARGDIGYITPPGGPDVNQSEWDVSIDPRPMLRGLPRAADSARRRRLFACACGRRVWERLTWPWRDALELSERYADGLVYEADVVASRPESSEPFLSFAEVVVMKAIEKSASLRANGFYQITEYTAGALAGDRSEANAPALYQAQYASLAGAVRCIFGNPFRPEALRSSAPVLVALARATYEGRMLPSGELDPDRVAVLADALEEQAAGQAFLDHLRGAWPHVRGAEVAQLRHRVEIARTGPEGIEAAVACEPDVVLLDLGLPGLSGYEVGRRIVASRPAKTPLVIAVTGYGTEADRQRSKEAGIDLHLVKPADPVQLERLLERFQSFVRY
jgi:CheY-like chemotaxis protein